MKVTGMIKEFKVIDRDDVTHTIPVEEGISAMELIRDELTPLGWGNCGGSMVCSTCHVYVKKGNFEEPCDEEQDVLDFVEGVQPTSRLSCQLFLENQKDEVLLQLGP